MARRAVRRKPEISRGEILDAALACFAERGYHETSIDDIAARAGLSKGAIYWHFAGKRELFLALVDRLGAGAADPRRGGGQPDRRSALHLLGTACAYCRACPVPLARTTSQSGRDEDIRIRAERGTAVEAGGRALIAKGVADGSLRPMPAAEVASDRRDHRRADARGLMRLSSISTPPGAWPKRSSGGISA
jgi:AcrR family transcriptional regulator